MQGRWRQRRSAPYLAWELEDGTILRYQKTQRRRIVVDRRFDAEGWPLTTHETSAGGLPRLIVHTAPSREIVLSGWSSELIPGGSVISPVPALPREGGGARFLVLGGEFDVWHDPRWADVYSETFRDGLVAGCGCILIDEMSAWIDNKPGKRFRLEVPGTESPDQIDIWAIPIGPPPAPLEPTEDGEAPEPRDPSPSGIWLASYRVAAPDSPTLQLAPGRAMVALAVLDRIDELVMPLAEPPPEAAAPEEILPEDMPAQGVPAEAAPEGASP